MTNALMTVFFLALLLWALADALRAPWEPPGSTGHEESSSDDEAVSHAGLGDEVAGGGSVGFELAA